jgi:tellurite resistance protein
LARFNTALYAAASADGYYDKSDSAAVKSVLQTVSVEGIE